MTKNINPLSIIIIAIFLSTSLIAQGTGIVGGLNMAQFTGDDVDDMGDQSYMPGFTFGGYMTTMLGGFTIRPEIHYTIKGGDFSDSETGDGAEVKTETTVKMNYLEVPVLGVFPIQDRISLFVGPYLEYYLSGTVDYEMSWTYDGESESDSDSEDLKKEDGIASIGYGIILGGSFGITDNIAIEARYSIGLSTIDTEPDDWDDEYGDYEESDVKHTGLQILINYSL